MQNKVVSFSVLFIVFVLTSSHIPSSNSDVTLQMLNCKPGVYLKFNDLLNGEPADLVFKGLTYKYKDSALYDLGVVVKGADGKEVLDCTEFWGWKSSDGVLYRNVPFRTGNTKAVPSRVMYAGKNFINYKTVFGAYHFRPNQWLSTNLKEPVYGVGDFVMKYPENSYLLMERYLYNRCEQTQVFTGNNEKPTRECMIKCPYLRFAFDDYGRVKEWKYISIDGDQ